MTDWQIKYPVPRYRHRTFAEGKQERMGILPTDAKARKDTPICTGVLDYFPRALAYVAGVSKKGNDQHNPGEPLHWAKEKSTDHPDCCARHLIERGTFDPDGALHDGKLAWRALANLETELERREREGLPIWETPPQKE